MHVELQNANILEKWFLYESETHGIVTFKTFEQTIEVLTKGSLIKNVRFKDVYNSNLPWIVSNNLDSTILKVMDEKLNDDCIRYIMKHLNVKDLIFSKNFNGRFEALVEEKMSKLRILPCTVGAIDLMNLRYILYMFGSYVLWSSVIFLHIFSALIVMYVFITWEMKSFLWA